MRYEVSYTDMTHIYDALFYEYCMDSFPQIMIFKELEVKSEVMRYEFEDGRSIIYLKESDKMLDNLVNELNERKAPKRRAKKYMHHPYSDETVAWLNYVCMLISKMLGIECPQLEFRSNQDTYGTSISEINLVIIQALEESQDFIELSVRYLAHELRHLWQYKNRPEYFLVPQHQKSMDEYMMSEEEHDAEAFANKLFYEITGWDSIRDNPDYADGNVSVIKRVLEVEKDIELDENIIEELRIAFGM